MIIIVKGVRGKDDLDNKVSRPLTPWCWGLLTLNLFRLWNLASLSSFSPPQVRLPASISPPRGWKVERLSSTLWIKFGTISGRSVRTTAVRHVQAAARPRRPVPDPSSRTDNSGSGAGERRCDKDVAAKRGRSRLRTYDEAHVFKPRESPLRDGSRRVSSKEERCSSPSWLPNGHLRVISPIAN